MTPITKEALIERGFIQMPHSLGNSFSFSLGGDDSIMVGLARVNGMIEVVLYQFRNDWQNEIFARNCISMTDIDQLIVLFSK